MEKEISIIIKTIDSRIKKIKVIPSISVSYLKEIIKKELNIQPINQRLIFQGKVLKDNEKLSDHKIENDHTIHLVIKEDISESRENISLNQQPNLRISPNNNNSNYPFSINNIVNDSMNRSQNLLQELNNYENFFQSAFRSINQNPVRFDDNNLRNLFNNISQVNNSQNENNVSNSSEFIPQTYSNLCKLNYNKTDSVEAIKQNIYIVNELFGNSQKINDVNMKQNLNKPIFNQSIHFKVGQWIDFEKSTNVWAEAQVLNIRPGLILVRPTDSTDEWVEVNSPRISYFRTFTVQSQNSKYLSPFPNKKPESQLTLINPGNFDNFENFNDIIALMDKLRDRIQRSIFEKDILNNKKSSFQEKKGMERILEEEINLRERVKFGLFCQLAPLMDRVGRLMIDFSQYIQNDNFEFFMKNHEKLNMLDSKQIGNSVNQKVIGFRKISNIPLIRNNGDLPENANTQIPRIGIIIAPAINRTQSNFPIDQNNNTVLQTNSRTVRTFNRESLVMGLTHGFSILINKKKQLFKEAETQTYLKVNQNYVNKIESFEILKLIKTDVKQQIDLKELNNRIKDPNSKAKFMKSNEKIIVNFREKVAENKIKQSISIKTTSSKSIAKNSITNLKK